MKTTYLDLSGVGDPIFHSLDLHATDLVFDKPQNIVDQWFEDFHQGCPVEPILVSYVKITREF